MPAPVAIARCRPRWLKTKLAALRGNSQASHFKKAEKVLDAQVVQQTHKGHIEGLRQGSLGRDQPGIRAFEVLRRIVRKTRWHIEEERLGRMRP